MIQSPIAQSVRSLFALLFFLFSLLLPIGVASAQDSRGKPSIRPVAERPATGSAGLFIGVNTFQDDSLTPLRFAVNDAVAMAHRFALELQLIPPANVTLALSGEPDATRKVALQRLLDAGARRTGADSFAIYAGLQSTCAKAKAAGDLLVISASSHGFNDADQAILCPANGMASRIRRTGIPLGAFQEDMGKSEAGKQLLFLDACRDQVRRDKKGGADDEVARRFRAAVSAFEGSAVLLSCDAGQSSFEAGELGLGVFTHFLLEGLGGAAEPDPRGFITLGNIATYTATEVERWAKLKKGAEQTPFLKDAKVTASAMPLAISRKRELETWTREVKTVIDAVADRARRDAAFSYADLARAEAVLADSRPGEAGESALKTSRLYAAGTIGADLYKTWLASQRKDDWTGTRAGQTRKDNELEMRFVWCPPGAFTMGSPKDEDGRNSSREEQVEVQLDGFWLGATEVTQAQWKRVMGTEPSHFKGSDLPVEEVSWVEAVDFCERLTRSERLAGRLPAGWTYRLPSEAQWEYGCRAPEKGPATVFAFGNSLSSRQANFDGDYPYGDAAKGPDLETTTRVGSYPSNRWGLFDMHGNVWEWCQDAYQEALPGGLNPLVEGDDRVFRVNRGGSWNDYGRLCRSATRFRYASAIRGSNLGFRVAVVPSNQVK